MKIIGHIDMDAFFAAIEERNRPHLKGKPIVVGSDPMEGLGRGVVSTANYKAREYGIKSAMPISKAWDLSESARKAGHPRTVFITPGFGNYSGVSQSIFNILRKHVPLVEPASIDEAYLDLSFKETYKKAESLAKQIKRDIFEVEKLTCSIGIGPNKLIAKIASDFNKPDGLTIVSENNAEEFIEPMSVRKIPGIGPKSEIELNKLGIKTIKDLKGLSRERLQELFGKWGSSIWAKARAIDSSPVVEEYEIKSIGEQETFDKDTLDYSYLSAKLRLMCGNIIKQMLQDGFNSFRTVSLTVRFKGFETKSRSHTLPISSNSLETLFFEASKLLMPFLDRRENPEKKLIRLIGIRIEKLELNLF